MFSLRNRVLVIASSSDSDSAVAYENFGATNADKITLEDFSSSSGPSYYQYSSISFFASSIDFSRVCNPKMMGRFYEAITPGGTVNFHLALSKETSDKILLRFKKDCIYGGFINPEITRDKENAQLRRTVQLVAQRPLWEQGAAVKVNDEGSLVDENTLLDNTTPYVPLGKGKSDCATKPKACANCTCGRKELEVELGAEEAKKRLENATVRSSCGNCYLGDAFRCSGCPYKGQPAFKPGSKVQLDLFQNDESLNVLTDSGGSEVQEGSMVKLQMQ